jgi:hypothetical protein
MVRHSGEFLRPAVQAAQSGGAGFEQTLQQVQEAQQPTIQAEPIDARGNQPGTRVENRVELSEPEVRFMDMDRQARTKYFAERIEPSGQVLAELREKAYEIRPGVWQTRFRQHLSEVDASYQELDRFLREYEGGREFSDRELLAMQLRSHQIMQNVEILSKTVEQSVSGMKTIFQTNV